MVMEEQLETQRYREGKRFFIYAPPLRGKDFGGRQSKRLPPNPPFIKAPPYKTSVYYYWWEFLRRSDAYKRCCKSGGKGKLSKLYEDFGDVFEISEGKYGEEFHTFWNWWTSKHPVSNESRGQTLFAEPKARSLTETVSSATPSDDTLIIEVPLELRTAFLVNQFRKVLQQHDKRHRTAQAISRAMYPVHTKPVLQALHIALVVYDAFKANEKAKHKKKLWQLFDEVKEQLDYFYVSEEVTFKGEDGEEDETLDLVKMEKAKAQGKLSYDDLDLMRDVREIVNRRKANAILRQQRIAKQYIANAEKGIFPKKTKR